MSFAIYPAMFFTVALLVVTAYFMLGGLPLLVLNHDTPLDARFIRGFFNVYYLAAIGTGLGACLSYALYGNAVFALGALAIAGVATYLRRNLLPQMNRLAEQIQAGQAEAVAQFRRLHGAALAFNLLQLMAIVACLIKISL